MSGGKHKCFAVGCDRQVQAIYLMCRQHWFMVPKDVQNAIWATVGKAVNLEAYRNAVADAVVAVARKEGLGEDEIMATMRTEAEAEAEQRSLL